MSQPKPIRRDCERAIKAIAQSRQAVEKILGGLRRDEIYEPSLLGPILAELRDAQQSIEKLKDYA